MGRLVLVCAGLWICFVQALAQQSNCADCHFADPFAPGEMHLDHWQNSAHGRNRIGCEKCHGGDSSTFEAFRAHQGVLSGQDPASPVHRQNLPATCGACHIGPFVEFQKSRHYQLLAEGNSETPVCTTCHGEEAAHLLSPRYLQNRCEGCHGEDESVPRPEYAQQATELLEGILEAREKLKQVDSLIRRVRDSARRQGLMEDLEQAQVPLTQAINSGHSFVFDDLRERLTVSRQRTERLLDELTNPE